jgi:cell wall hydrolase
MTPLPLYPDDAQIKALLTPTQVVAMTIRGEAAAEVVEGQIAIGCVIRNRLLHPERFGGSWSEVCLRKWQFSCWIPEGGQANYRSLLAACEQAQLGLKPWPEQCLWIAEGIITGRAADRVVGATHYYADWMAVPPKWAEGQTPCATIGVHRFYRGIR